MKGLICLENCYILWWCFGGAGVLGAPEVDVKHIEVVAVGLQDMEVAVDVEDFLLMRKR